MEMLKFKVWEAVRTLQHARGAKRFVKINGSKTGRMIKEQEGEFVTPSPEDFSKEELERIEKGVRDKVAYAVGRLLQSHPFFAEALTKLKYVYTYSVDTAATDGSHMFINPMFFMYMNNKAVEFVVLHEVMHCMLLHFLRMEQRKHKKWNIATDFEINLVVVDELGYDMTQDPILKGGLYDTAVRGMSAEQIYDRLPEYPSCENGKCNFGEDEDGESSGSKPGQGKPGRIASGGAGEPLIIGEVISAEEGKKILKEEGISSNSQINNNDARDWDKIFEEGAKAREAARRKGAGLGSGGLLDGIIQRRLESKIDWKQELEKFVGDVVSSERLRIPSKKHITKGEYRSRMRPYAQALDNVVCSIDTSGSMLNYVPPLFFEMASILDAENVQKMEVLYFDTKIDHAETLEKGEFPDKNRIKGGGGTLFMPTVDWINQNMPDAELVIIMSDGDNFDTDEFYTQDPEWGENCIWLIVDKPSWEPPFGRVIHISERELLS